MQTYRWHRYDAKNDQCMSSRCKKCTFRQKIIPLVTEVTAIIAAVPSKKRGRKHLSDETKAIREQEKKEKQEKQAAKRAKLDKK